MANFTGTPGDDIYTGGNDADTIDGNGGNDQLSGGGGNDSISGGSGADTLNGGDGDDTLYSGDRSPQFNLPYYGNPFTPPLLDTGAERDTLIGGQGSDTLFAGYGDNVDGGDGTDTLYISFLGAPAGVVVDFRLASQTIGGGLITGIENVGWVQGSNFDDDINVAAQSNGYSPFTAVFGMGGNDHLTAGYYTGYLDGGDGDDIVDGRGSQYLQQVNGGAGDDTLYTNTNTFAKADGGDGDDRIFAHGEIHGGDGNDYIEVQYSYYSGIVYGDGGDDEIHAAAQVAATIIGGSGADTITGSSYADTIATGGYTLGGYYGTSVIAGDDNALDHDVVMADAGNDSVSGGYGDDLDGGTGTDQLRYSFGGLSSGIDFDTSILVGGQPASIGGGTIQNFESLVYLRGTDFDDVIRLAAQDTQIEVRAGAGNDVVYTGGSSAAVYGEAGNDTFVSGPAGDTFDGGDGLDTVDYSLYASAVTVALAAVGATGTGPGGDQLISIEGITGSAYDDTLTGNAVANVIHGGDGNDLIDGGAGNDTLFGGAGDDQIKGGDGADSIDGGTGNDQINGGTGADAIAAGEGDDVITVSGSQNGAGLTIAGGVGVDRLVYAGTSGQFSGTGVSSVEQLEVRSGGTLTGLSGFGAISTAAATSATTFRSSLDPAADLTIGTALVTLQSSTIANVQGSDSANKLTLSDSTQVSGAVNLGGGDDLLTLSRAIGSLPGIAGGADGGAGVDTLALTWTQTNATYAVDLAGYRNFEVLNVNTANAAGSAVRVINASGWNQIVAGAGTALSLSGTLTDTNVSVASGSLTLESRALIRRIGLPDNNGAVQPTDQNASNPAVSLTVTNNGTVSGDIVFNTGNDVYNGQNGSVAGTVYGNGGNDQLTGGSGVDRFDGGYGNDILTGGLGADVLRGGAGADLFRDSAVGHNGDTITDFTFGDMLVFSDVSASNFTFSLSGNVLTYAGGSMTLEALPTGSTLVASAAIGGGVQLVLRAAAPTADPIFAPAGAPVVANFNPASGWTSQDSSPRHVADVNGDGNLDVVGFGTSGVLIAYGSADGTFSNAILTLSNFGQISGWTSDNQAHRVLADLNGDGRADIIGFGVAGTLVSLAQASGGYGAVTTGIADFGRDQAWTSQDGFARLVGDINGDGKADIVGFGYAGTLVALGNGDGTFQSTMTGLANFGANQGWTSDNRFHRELADVNGDGRADIVGFGAAGTYVALSNGDGTFAAARLGVADFGTQQGWASQDGYTRIVVDVNGDHLADIVGFTAGGSLIAFGNGDGSFQAVRSAGADFGRGQGWLSDNTNHREIVDINHDGFPDIVGFGTAGVLVGVNNLGYSY